MSRVAGRSLEVVEIDGGMVRYLRGVRGDALSQEALARRVGISSALVGHIETGYTRRVSRHIVEGIARELDVSPVALTRARGDGQEDRIEASLERISHLLERLAGEAPALAPGKSDLERDERELELLEWATDFMRDNSRRAPCDPSLPDARYIAGRPWRAQLAASFDLAQLPPHLEASIPAKLVHGSGEAALALVDALTEGTKGPPQDENRTILFTYQGHDLFAVVEPDLRIRLLRAMRSALDRGWNILHLIRYSTLSRRYLDITSQVVDLAGMDGRYVVKYLADDPDSSTDFDVLVIPGHCTVQLWSTQAGKPADAAIVLCHPAVQHQMAAVFQQRAAAARTFIDAYPQYTAILGVLQQPEPAPGDRFQIKTGPLPETVPKEFWRWAAGQVRRPLEATGDDRTSVDLVDQYERAMIKRSVLLDATLTSFSVYQLVTAESLDDLVEGRYHRNDWLIAEAQSKQPDCRVPAELRIAHLQRLVELLDRYERFHLGIAEPERMDEPFPHNLLSVRMGIPQDTGMAAYVQAWPQPLVGEHNDGYHAVFRERRIVSAFHQYFSDLWNGPGVVTDRATVCEMLRARIREVEEISRRAGGQSPSPRKRVRQRRS